VIALLLGGCVAPATYEIKVRGVAASPMPATTSYRLVEQTVPAEYQALYTETSRVVRSALATKGMSEVAPGAEPDVLIRFGAGVRSSSFRNSLVAEPIFVMIPGAIRYETVQVATGPNGTPIMGTVARQDPPTQQVSGYYNRPIVVEYFRKGLQLIAYKNQPSGDHSQPVEAWAQQVWAAEASYESEDKNLKAALPFLAAGCMVYAGKDSGGRIPIQLKHTDPDVVAIKRGK